MEDQEADPNNGSFENYFDTGSNNEDPYLANEGGGLMINMHDLKNVRESYSKNLDKAGMIDQNERQEQRMDMMMMMEIGGEG
jgi:hypothetical protein